MKVLFVGSAIRTDDLMKYKGPSVAGNKMQMGFLKELYIKYKDDLSILTQIPISQYPSEKKLIFKSHQIKLADNLYSTAIGFINFPFVKQFLFIRNTKKKIRKWLKAFPNENKIVICYNALPQIAKPVLKMRKNDCYRAFSILADPPIDSIKRSLIKRIFKTVEQRLSVSMVKLFDGVIALNQKMVDDYTPQNEYIIIEGGIDLDYQSYTPRKHVNEKYLVVYSGALTEYSGVNNLIQSLTFIKRTDFVIHIYGQGPLEQMIKEKMSVDQRIIYKGSVANKEMIKIQANADLLINPRTINDPISTYTFPSKILEYLASGTPTLTTKINGLLPEYLNYLFYTHDDTPKGIAKSLEEVLNLDRPKMIETAKKGKIFVLENKNWKKQTDKLIHFIEKN